MSSPQQPGYGQFTGYAPLPGGQGYAFQLANGGSVPFVGEQGEELRKRVDASKAAHAALANALPPQAPPAAIAAPQEQAAPPTASRLFSQKDGSTVSLRDGGDPSNPAHYVKTIPGRAGSRGGMAEVGRQSQGGYNVDEQFLEQMESSKVRQASAEERGSQQAMDAATERQSFMQTQKQQLEREAAVQAHENATKQKRMGELQSKFEQAESDFMNFHENREKGVAGSKEKMANFIGGLAGALGALGASLARTPNFAAEAVARNREMMMRREEAELRVKKDSRDSLLGQLNEQTGSLELAKTAYRAIHSRQSALGWEALAAKEQDAQKQTTMMRAAELSNQEYLKWREAYTRGAEGEVTRSFKFVPGQSASGPRQAGVSIEEASQLADLAAKNAGIAKTEADTGKTRAEIASGTAGGTKLSDTSANSFANIAAVRGQLPGMLQASGEEGVMAVDKVPLIGGALESQGASTYKAKAEGLARLAGKAVEGDAAAESNVLALTARLNSPLPGHREAAIKALDTILAAKEKEMKRVVPGAPK